MTGIFSSRGLGDSGAVLAAGWDSGAGAGAAVVAGAVPLGFVFSLVAGEET